MTRRSVSCHVDGLPAPRAVLEHGFPIQAVLTQPPEIRRSEEWVGDWALLCGTKP